MLTQEPDMPDQLPSLPFWQARSWWMTLLAVIAPLLSLIGIDWPWVSDPATVDVIMQVVGGVAAALAWRERLNPHKRLTLTRENV
jgi:hypothetical protein